LETIAKDTQKALYDSAQVLALLNSEVKIRSSHPPKLYSPVYFNYCSRGIFALIKTKCCVYILDNSVNVSESSKTSTTK
jgi:hypothetical protein